jgi:hypothetical protein
MGKGGESMKARRENEAYGSVGAFGDVRLANIAYRIPGADK